MPSLDINGARYFYLDEGPSGGNPAATLVFGHGFLMTHRLFDAQVEALRGRYRCIRFDWRGQGASEVVGSGYGVPELAEDAAALIEALDAAPCVYVGLSMGGFAGFHLALERPELLRGLVLMETRAGIEPWHERLQYNALLLIARFIGYGPVLRRAMALLFGPAFRNDPARAAEREEWTRIMTGNDRVGVYRAGRGIWTRDSVEARLGDIDVRTLVLVGEDDVPTPPAAAAAIRDGIPGAEMMVLPRAGHTSPVETPGAVTAALESFLEGS